MVRVFGAVRAARTAGAAGTAVALLAAAGCGLAGGGDGGAAAGSADSVYLSLGDSLAVGVQPDGEGGAGETRDGYTDMLYRTLRDTDSSLRHERLGCGGEDTTTFIGGGVQGCGGRYPEGSQLAEAERFLLERGDDVALVTIGIGGNNFTSCVDVAGEGADAAASVDEDCVDDGMERLELEAPEIAGRLADAAAPGTQLVGMTYFNPFAAALLIDGGDGAGAGGGAELAEYGAGVLEEMNGILRDAYGDAGFAVADVAEAFDSGQIRGGDGADAPPAAAEAACDYTWMCDPDRGPDVHTNPAGARLIAETFADAAGS